MRRPGRSAANAAAAHSAQSLGEHLCCCELLTRVSLVKSAGLWLASVYVQLHGVTYMHLMLCCSHFTAAMHTQQSCHVQQPSYDDQINNTMLVSQSSINRWCNHCNPILLQVSHAAQGVCACCISV
jgi:hypothetical protein